MAKYKYVFFICLFSFATIFYSGCSKVEELANYFAKQKIKSKKTKLADWEKGIKDLEDKINQCVVDSNRLGVFYRKLGLEHVKRRNFNQAIKYYSLALEHGEEKPIVYHDLGAIYANKARFEKQAQNHKQAMTFGKMSLINYNKALLKDPRRSSSKFGKALLFYYVLNRKKDGIVILEQMRKKFPKDGKILFALGRIYFEEKQYSKAVNIYQLISEIFPKDSDQVKNAQLNIRQSLLLMKRNKK